MAVNLLRRKNWARLASIALLAVLLLEGLAALIVFPESPAWMENVPLMPMVHVGSAPGQVVSTSFFSLASLVLVQSLFYAWALLTLKSKAVCEEFRNAA